MDAKREQFVRLAGEAIVLLRQARTAASLAPQRALSAEIGELVSCLEGLRDDRSFWFFGQDSQGRMISEAGQVLEPEDE